MLAVVTVELRMMREPRTQKMRELRMKEADVPINRGQGKKAENQNRLT